MPPHVAPRRTDAPTPALPAHPTLVAAARGDLPSWAVAGPRRREHMARVADLLGTWADGLGLSEGDCIRWRAAGFLHDALRDERPDALRPLVPPTSGLSDPVLHGPAAAERLRQDGVDDAELLEAIASHTVGGRGLRRLSRALYIADYIEPGRGYTTAWHEGLRERMPSELHDVLLEVVRERVRRGRESGRVVAPETLAMLAELEGEGA